MKENVIDVLMFLFDNYLTAEEGVSTDEETLTYELREAGFETKEITKAFDWLEGLAGVRQLPPGALSKEVRSIRVYTLEEEAKLGAPCRGFLLGLEQTGILDPISREIIIDRAMAIDTQTIRLQQFKRIVGLIMVNRTHREEILAWLEDLIYDDIPEILH